MDKLLLSVLRVMGHESHLAGSGTSAHLPLLYLMAKVFGRIGSIVECGVGRGCTTVPLLAGAIETNGILHSIDTMPCRSLAIKTGRLNEIPENVLDQHWKFTQSPNQEVAKGFPDNSIGLLFLDTTHKYDDTKAELAAWLPKIHPNGVVCGHDYFCGHHPGLKPAVDEFAHAENNRFRLSVYNQDQGLFVLWPKSVDC